MTIIYKQFDKHFIEEQHGRLYFYRDLYEGNHSAIFERAQTLLKKGEIVDNLLRDNGNTTFVRTPYLSSNICKNIVEIPAMLIARSIGKITTSYKADEEQIEESNETTNERIEGTEDETINGTIVDLQQELIQSIVNNSNLEFEHWSNLVQHQVDGGLVGVPWDGDEGLRLEFKARDVYFPHEDGLGADIAYKRSIEGKDYLHIYRERIEKNGLKATHMVQPLSNGGMVQDLLDPEDAAGIINMEVDQLEKFYPLRNRTFIRYWANAKTFMQPLGISALRNMDGRQDEINWTLTRTAGIFERNGKPRIAISTALAKQLQKKMADAFGPDAKGKFDHRDLEITTFDEKTGKALEIIQIDTTKIGDVQWVKDLMKTMLTETSTSEKAVDFYMDSGGGAGQSGVAKFYDLFTSLMKAEHLQKEYIHFIKGLIEDALWLANYDDPAVIIEKPEIDLVSMIPVQRKEIVDENIAAFEKNAQSLETTVRRNNPGASEEWVQEELARIEESASDDSTSLSSGRQTLNNFLDNPDTRTVTPLTTTAAIEE